MVHDISYQSVSQVLESWELARQKYGTEEELGRKILLNLFRADPAIKEVFGFQRKQDIESNPMLLMGVMVHGTRMVAMLDSVLALLGPDTELLEEVLGSLGKRHRRYGVKKEYFALMGAAIRDAIADIFGDLYSDADDKAWKEVFDAMSAEIVRAME
jgi:hemoglobin-like flavoprotein